MIVSTPFPRIDCVAARSIRLTVTADRIFDHDGLSNADDVRLNIVRCGLQGPVGHLGDGDGAGHAVDILMNSLDVGASFVQQAEEHAA